MQEERPRITVCTFLVAAAHLYLVGMISWGIARTGFGDRWWWLFFLNAFGIYLFVPLVVIVGIAWRTHRRELWIGCGLVLTMGVALYGELFLPKWPPARTDAPVLRVMTFNMLGYNGHPEGIVAAIQEADVDLVAIQELNPAASAAIEQELKDQYPYQVLDPQVGVTGMGVISRYPLRVTGESLPGSSWIGTPQILALTFSGRTVTILHFHPYPTSLGHPNYIETSIRAREQQVQAVVTFAREHPGPLIAPVDLNTGDQSRAYMLLTEDLQDAWREVGWGLGHTFPGAASPGSSRLTLFGVSAPRWMVRIDYIFHSQHFCALEAHLGPWDGVSDHRSVIAALALQD